MCKISLVMPIHIYIKLKKKNLPISLAVIWVLFSLVYLVYFLAWQVFTSSLSF